eukprot:TRINITY_DN3147_c1_g1_i1.p1 TRINITY_DN3147_c1_g1~~TRINITY_DN3147_c1_g1_i1.p1  ORF type:complete len:279 (+),score=120.27 TRINITY_DN3147_c1_g1_i1:68-904(+)
MFGRVFSFFRRSPVAAISALSIGLGTASTIGQSMLYNVDGGERALVFDRYRGVLPKPVGEGTHFVVPILQYPILMDIRTTPLEFASLTGSKDLQQVKISLRVLYRPHEDSLRNIYLSMGMNYAEKMFLSIGNEVLKSIVAQFDAGELITQREVVSMRIRENLVKRAADFGVVLEDVAITHLDFSSDYVRAIEHKQVAQQMAMRQKFLVEKAKQEKQAEVIIAEGETEAGRLIADSYRDGKEFLQLRRIEAARDIARYLARSPGVHYVPSTGNLLMQLK